MNKEVGSKKYGAFNGVFIPTFLTIVGVILFLRLGVIVGTGGVIGSILIILLAVSVSFSTGFALSSIITNIRIGAGGAYSIISKTLGLEIGGSVGIPLYLAQVLSVALYIFGFTEAWRFMFPGHSKIAVLLIAFATLFLLTFISTKIAMRTQIVVFLLLLASLISIFISGSWYQELGSVSSVSFPYSSFWTLFALFFPAITGLMAGIGLSGELSDPKKQIPRGVLAALGTTTLIYILMVLFLASSASPAQLTENNLIIIDLAFYSPLVLLGILASTFSSALTTLVAAPRILQALGKNQILPKSKFFEKTHGSEPRNAVLFTGLAVGLSLLFGNLNTIAPVLTMFFLITYAAINLSVFLEQSLGLVGFRPTFKIPKGVPLYGFLSSAIFMFYINIYAGFMAIIILIGIYLLLVKKKIKPKQGDVRSGLFFAISEWAAKQVTHLPESREHVWKPHILLPIKNSKDLLSNYKIINSMLKPEGTLSVIGMGTRKNKDLRHMGSQIKKFEEQGIFANYTTVESEEYLEDTSISLEAIEGQFFHPNILFLPLESYKFELKKLEKLIHTTRYSKSGLIFFKKYKVGLGLEKNIHLWIDDSVLEKDFYEDREFDLAMLLGYKIKSNWKGKITMHMITSSGKAKKAKKYLKRLLYESRFPSDTKIKVNYNLKKAIEKQKSDINLISFENFEQLKEKYEKLKEIKKTYMFVMDSRKEDVLA